jgi:hypothetical protein
LNSIEDRYDALTTRVERSYPESVTFSEERPLLVGEFLRLDEGHTSYGPAKIAVLRTKDEREVGVWLLHTALKSAFARLRPKPGELVAIRYEGKRESAAGQTYDSYRVEIDRARGADWDALGAEADAEQESEGDVPF